MVESANTSLLPFALRAPPPKLKSQASYSVLDLGGRHLPVLTLRLPDAKMAAQVAIFPITLQPIRAAYLAPAARAALPPDTDLLIEAHVPEVVGEAPLAQWTLASDSVLTMARANTSSGALLLQIETGKKRDAPLRRVLSPFWLDWQGWSGAAFHLARAATPPDSDTLHALVHELEERGSDGPSGIATARARLLSLLDNVPDAAQACQDEVGANLTDAGLPSIGSLEALVLLGTLLRRHGEGSEARAALSLALWLHPNNQAALVEIIPLLTDEAPVTDALARLALMPQRPRAYAELLADSSSRLQATRGALESKVSQSSKQGPALLAAPPPWLQEGSARTWMSTIGF